MNGTLREGFVQRKAERLFLKSYLYEWGSETSTLRHTYVGQRPRIQDRIDHVEGGIPKSHSGRWSPGLCEQDTSVS